MPQGRPGSGHGRGNPHALGAVRHRGRGHGGVASNWGIVGRQTRWKDGELVRAGFGGLAAEEGRRCQEQGDSEKSGERFWYSKNKTKKDWGETAQKYSEGVAALVPHHPKDKRQFLNLPHGSL